MRQQTQSRSTFELDVIYQAVAPQGAAGGAAANVFTPKHLAAMAALEQAITSHANYSNFCLVNPGSGQCQDVASPVHWFTDATSAAAIAADLNSVMAGVAITPQLDVVPQRIADAQAAQTPGTAPAASTLVWTDEEHDAVDEAREFL